MAVEWNGYELHPETPPGGVPLGRLLPNADAMLRYVRAFAEGFGISDLVLPARVPSTRRILAASERARDAGRLEAFRAAAFDAHWRRGLDIESDSTLATVAREAAVDPDAAIAAASDASFLARVDAARARALAAGVTGIPTLDVGTVRVVGCQPYEALAAAAKKVGACRVRH